MYNFEIFLNNYLDSLIDSKIKDAMKYAIVDGGKRFRPNLIFSIVKGFNIDESDAYHAALALEMVHTYSLIHDDLPCMDDDDYRRGKLATHKKYGEDIAVLAGDALLTESFHVIINDTKLTNEKKVKLIDILSFLAGVEGMIHGQLLDLESENKTDISAELINEIHDYKTGCLFKCALEMGMIIADDESNKPFYDDLALRIGRIFQVQDDLFDIIKTSEEMGKPTKSDLKNHKTTALSLASIDEIKLKLDNEFKDIYSILKTRNFNTEFLYNIINKMQKR